MKIDRLRTLHQDMRKNNLTRCQFSYSHNKLKFDVLFVAEGSPYELLFGVVGHNCSFLVTVAPGYEITARIKPESAFYKLIELLDLTPDPNNRFSANTFFSDFSKKIPVKVGVNNSSKLPASITPHVNDADKTIFSHWKNNSAKSGNVSLENLEKTLKAFGPVIQSFCASKNISSCWSPTNKK